MKKYLIFNAKNFEIVGSEERPDNEPYEPVGDLDCIEIDENSCISEYYFKNSQLTKRPKKPSEEYIWNCSEWVINELLIAAKTKSARNALLQESDWTDTVTAQTRLTNWQQWQDYRQALRDIPQQAGYPLDVIWPEQPK